MKVTVAIVINILFAFVVLVQSQKFVKDTTINEKEKRKLEEFRARVVPKLWEEFMTEDIYLIKWLRAGFFNLDRAEKLILDNAKWRKDKRMEKIHEEDWSEFQRDFPFSLKGRDKEGLPQLFIPVGDWDLRQAAVAGKADRLIRYVDKLYDEATSLVRELGRKYQNVTQIMVILDEGRFSLLQHGCLQCIPIVIRAMTTYEAHFTGYANKIILVNTPTVAEPVIRLAREALHPITNQVMKVYGTNKSLWWKALMEDFTPDQIPTNIGGTLKAIDSTGSDDYDYKDNL